MNATTSKQPKMDSFCFVTVQHALNGYFQMKAKKSRKKSLKFLSLISLSVYAFSEDIREMHSIVTLLFERAQSVYNIHRLRPPFH